MGFCLSIRAWGVDDILKTQFRFCKKPVVSLAERAPVCTSLLNSKSKLCFNRRALTATSSTELATQQKWIYHNFLFLSTVRYPVILKKFHLNPGTGGAGQHWGGDGIIREYLFRKDLTLSILTERRVFSPYGLNG